MPELKVRQEYVDKLNSEGLYEKWFSNVKKQHDQWFADRRSIMTTTKKALAEAGTFNEFIAESFFWGLSDEGYSFWKDVSSL
jgi:hypothetical protein